jgi:hypothetical protein
MSTFDPSATFGSHVERTFKPAEADGAPIRAQLSQPLAASFDWEQTIKPA